MSDHDEITSPELNYEVFEFANLSPAAFEDVVLSNTERQQLRDLASEGGPLWRIMQGLISYKVVLEQVLGDAERTNLFADDGIAKAASLQAEIRAVKWQYEMWQRQLTYMPPRDEDQIDV